MHIKLTSLFIWPVVSCVLLFIFKSRDIPWKKKKKNAQKKAETEPSILTRLCEMRLEKKMSKKSV